MSDVRKALAAARATKKTLAKFADELPDLDANCAVYSIAMHAVEALDKCLQTMPSAMKEARRLAKKNPNRAGKTR